MCVGVLCDDNKINSIIALLQEVLQNIKLPDADGKSPTIAINLVLQFLFYELRYRTDIRKWFYRKLSLELDELLTKTTTGKLFDKLSVSGGMIQELENGFHIKTILFHS